MLKRKKLTLEKKKKCDNFKNENSKVNLNLTVEKTDNLKLIKNKQVKNKKKQQVYNSKYEEEGISISNSEDEIKSDFNESSSDEQNFDFGEKEDEDLKNVKWDSLFQKKFNLNEENDSNDSAHESDNEINLDKDDNTFADFDKSEILNQSLILKNKNLVKTNKVTNKIKPVQVNKNKVVVEKDEYSKDSSDEEDLKNTIGNIPINLYDSYNHIGYDLSGNKILKPHKDDEIDNFLNKIDDQNYYRTVFNPQTGEKIILTDDDLEILTKIKKGKYPDKYFDPYSDFIDFFSYKKEEYPVTNHPIPKSRFIPSLSEKKIINKLVLKIRRYRSLPQKKRSLNKLQFNYDMWEKDHEGNKWYQRRILAPKLNLPGHAESYNPPSEYLFTDKEKEEWLSKETYLRRINFIPQKYSCLRNVPQYSDYIKERYERCLELYLKPRSKKEKANFRTEDLLPQLPKPSELKPYPTHQSLVYIGHKLQINSISIEKQGQFMASGSDDCTIKIWEILSGRCLSTIELNKPIKCLTWCPNIDFNLLLICSENYVYLINPLINNRNLNNDTDNLFKSNKNEIKKDENVEWIIFDEEENNEEWKKGIRVQIEHNFEINQVTWHHKGDYFAVVMPTGKNKSVIIHQLSKFQSQVPFKKSKGIVQKVLFHPIKPYFLVGTQRYVRIYNLVKQELTKKLINNCKYLSSMSIHPKGDNIIIGSYDNKLNWFDLDLSNKPYKTLKYHRDCIKQVCFHQIYPLFASGASDGKIIVSHGMVYNDFTMNALIVPVKTLIHGDSNSINKGIQDCVFHPNQPWIFTSGNDATIRLFS